jgi:hypothetical protein
MSGRCAGSLQSMTPDRGQTRAVEPAATEPDAQILPQRCNVCFNSGWPVRQEVQSPRPHLRILSGRPRMHVHVCVHHLFESFDGFFLVVDLARAIWLTTDSDSTALYAIPSESFKYPTPRRIAQRRRPAQDPLAMQARHPIIPPAGGVHE